MRLESASRAATICALHWRRATFKRDAIGRLKVGRQDVVACERSAFMSMSILDSPTTGQSHPQTAMVERADPIWKPLYRAAAVAALMSIALIFAAVIVFISNP